MWSLLVQLKWKKKHSKYVYPYWYEISELMTFIATTGIYSKWKCNVITVWDEFKRPIKIHHRILRCSLDRYSIKTKFNWKKEFFLSIDRLCNFQTINQFYSCVMLPLSPVASHTNSNSKLIMSCSINVFGKSLVTHISLWGVGRRDALYTMWDIRKMTMFTDSEL